MSKRVEEIIMQYTELVYWDGEEVIESVRMDDDHSYDSRGFRDPDEQELSDYYRVDVENTKGDT